MKLSVLLVAVHKVFLPVQVSDFLVGGISETDTDVCPGQDQVTDHTDQESYFWIFLNIF